VTRIRAAALLILKTAYHTLQLVSLIAMSFFVGASTSLYFMPAQAQTIQDRVGQVTKDQAMAGVRLEDLARRVGEVETRVGKDTDRLDVVEGSLNRIFGFGAALGTLLMILQVFQILNGIRNKG
jgi:hypothetical protein